jgi:MFS family permease
MSDSADGGYPRPAVGWYVAFMLMLCFTLSYVDRQILSFLVEPMKADLHISDTQIGLIQGLYFAIPYTVVGLFAGVLADRFNRRNIVIIGLVFWSLMTTASSVARSYFTLALARVGLGSGEAPLNPCAFSLIADYFPKERLASALSVYTMGIQVGSGMALIIGGLVAQAVADRPPVDVPIFGTMASWRVSFLIVGLPGLLVALALLTVKEPVRRSLLRNSEGAVVRVSLGEMVSLVLARWQSVLSLGFMIACMSMCNYALLNWGPAFFQRVHHWPRDQIGLVLGIITLVCGCGGLVVGGRLADYWHRMGKVDGPLRVALLSLIGAGVTLPLAMMMPTATLTVAFLVVAVFCIGLPIGSIYAAVQFIFANQVRGFASAVVLFIVTITGLTLGSLLPGLYNDYLFRDPLKVGYSVALTVGVASVVGIIIVLTSLRTYRRHYALANGTPATASIS